MVSFHKYLYRIFLLFCLTIVFSCGNSNTTKAVVNESIKDSVVLNLNVETLKNISFYKIEADSIRMRIEVWEGFANYRNTIEDLSKLNQKSILTFLEESDIETKKLRKSLRPDYLNSLEIDSRLTLLETRILKCKFYAEINDEEKLNEELKLLYRDYNFWLKIVEDIAKQNINYEQ